MLPSILSEQIRTGFNTYLQSNFSLADGAFQKMLLAWLASGQGIKGPYFSFGLPFRTSQSKQWFPELDLEFAPHMHQARAFERLSPDDASPKSTIVATGTGSGKTECFLYPIYAHCLREYRLGNKGIKAILIYPMNALATDQAARIAAFIYQRKQLHGIRAGLYIGGKQDNPTAIMNEKSVITDRKILRENPPDILITNYKMLDLLLQRIEDKPLWSNNKSDTLRFLVVDELHTFDGAQGTDLACLIRRLKKRLGVETGELCCIGTSATLSNEADAKQQLLEYVKSIFGEDFQEDAVIHEDRLSAIEFLGSEPEFVYSDTPSDLNVLLPVPWEGQVEYLCRQYQAWFGEEAQVNDFSNPTFLIALGHKLKAHIQFRNCVRSIGSDVVLEDELLERLFRKNDALAAARLNSLLALVSVARTECAGYLVPLLQMRAQLWIRELTGMLATVEAEPKLYFRDDLDDHHQLFCLPVVYCRECGLAGWVSTTNLSGTEVRTDTRALYQTFFSEHPAYDIFFPDMPTHGQASKNTKYLCGQCRALYLPTSDPSCKHCGNTKPVPVLHMRVIDAKHCPCCGAHDPWIILGSRSASLTSAVISTLTASRLNSDKKILTFSDNVQDAAQRAGFYSARTYGSTLQAALLQCLHAQDTKPLLAEFRQKFEEYWLKRTKNKQEYVALFLPPSMEWLPLYETMKDAPKADGSVDKHLFEMLQKRLDWDFYATFTYLSTMHRTLEKMGAAVAFVPFERMQQVAKLLHEAAINELECLKHCSLEHFLLFLVGFLRHLRRLGAVFYSETLPIGKKLHFYAKNNCNIFAIRNDAWMPVFGRRSKVPVFLSAKEERGFLDFLYRPGKETWCQRWARTVFHEYLATDTQDTTKEIAIMRLYELSLSFLERNGLVVAESRREKQPIWGLSQDALQLSCIVKRLKCEQCGRVITVDSDEYNVWVNSPCVREACRGHYLELKEDADFYAGLYTHGDVYRLFTSEHTGLLERKDREDIEESFKREDAERHLWDLNLLSCTPTLEMGIDIGSLSTTIQCSVPPTQANYLQRTGRAGRKNGNALTITIATGRSHDLYFFARPKLMMCGAVTPPAIFLNAAAVLERQLTAFCIDCWIAKGTNNVGIPRAMEDVLKIQSKVKKGRISDDELRQHFPYNLLEYIQQNATDLHNDFVTMFPHLSPETSTYLKSFITGSDNISTTPLFSRMVALIAREEVETSAYAKRRKNLSTKRSEINKKMAQGLVDDTTKEDQETLSREISALTELYKKALNRSPFEFLADESFLPNYAFPEQGVTLHSVIYKKLDDATKPQFDSQTFTYQRSASSAISEFAPGNNFYAGKRKVTITKVDLLTNDRKLVSKGLKGLGGLKSERGFEEDCVEPWRMCAECSYMELNNTDVTPIVCPRCGSEEFADAGRVFNLLRVSQVFANTSDSTSRVDDSAESRATADYVKNLLIDYAPIECKRAFALDTNETTFAFAYIGKASFREINFGVPQSTEPVTIAGKSVPKGGFKICRYCGCVLSDAHPRHDWGCKGAKLSTEEAGIDCLYLYRHFESEAIKILLPFTSSERSPQLESFIAAFNMGLKLKFGGALQHLQTTLHTEPDLEDTGFKRQFLVVFDSVPGGTGYLKQLMEGTALIDILELALKHLEDCDCKDVPGEDGCYACLRAYRNSARSSLISKHKAIAILRPIVNNKATLKEIESLDDVSISANFESELERLFIEALRRSSTAQRPIALKNELIHGKTGFFLTIGQRHWLIEQQVELGQEEGVSVPSRADFVFYPAKSEEGLKPIVLFTDGWKWHKDRLGKDLEQRTAIVNSKNYLVWSLTWYDIEPYLKSVESQPIPDFIEPIWNNQVQQMADILRAQIPNFADMAERVNGKNAMEMFLDYLAEPNELQYANLATMYTYLYAVKHQTIEQDYQAALQPLDAVFQNWAMPPELKRQSLQQQGCLTRFFGIFGDNYNLEGATLFYLQDDASNRAEEDSFKNTWLGLLRAINLFQFLPLFAAYCDSGNIGAYLEIHQNRASNLAKNSLNEKAWQDAMQLLYLPGEQNLLTQIHELGLSLPVLGHPLTDANECVVGELEMAWIDKKVGIVAPDDVASATAAQESGWQVIPFAEALEHPEKLVELVGV
ncbi:MAG: DEAD/DEAH box helicase [Desulfovibrionaceae bacterium]|nr:DEAD/DEAH box helicase [Desulfovibrionaceae bacterium]